ncbi:sensor domain-containing diguanylate cyclase [uncultured Amphritea sp.]|uniref:sensor domain-containing diguanylate cyclase n=1 Tax=uncultured Amphritea sp. TaxID=981605 RepID=UPI0025DF001B|nr:sensor domain-containing diguanylate cyclase [uncultured Amphritea sp.]
MLMMQVMQKLDIETSFFWLEVFLDAVIIASITTLTVRYLVKTNRLKIRQDLNFESVLLRTGLIALGVETMLMLTFPLINISTTSVALMVSDGLLFALITTLLIHYLLLKPGKLIPLSKRSLIERTLALRGFLLFLYLSSLSLLLLLLLNVYQQQQHNSVSQVVTAEQPQLALIRKSLNDHISIAALDTLILARQENLQEWLDGDTTAKSRLTHDYLSLASIKPVYEQIRFIDETGIEQIRIDQGSLEPVIIGTESLQDKHNRYYFTDSFKLSSGQVYISPMDLNIEHDQIELPIKPIVRTASPVFDQQGNKRGVIVINLNASALFTQLKGDAKNTTGELMLLNENGYWMFGREQDAAWAFMFPEYKDRTIEKYYPGIWQKIISDERGAFLSPYGYFIFDTIATGRTSPGNPEQKKQAAELRWPEWKLISLASPQSISIAYSNILPQLIMFFILTALVTGTGTIMYFRIQRKNLIAQQQIEHLAHHDMLTGLNNRNIFIQMLESQLAHSRRSNKPLALLYMDLDNFKPINDQYGHEAGDYVLKQFAARLKLILRESDTLARLGGDEFAAILPSYGNRRQLEIIAQRIISAIEKPVTFGDQHLQVGISIGIAIHLQGPPLESLLHEADQAMYEAKRTQNNSYSFAEEPQKQQTA